MVDDGHPDFVVITIINEEFNAVRNVFESASNSRFKEVTNPRSPVGAFFLTGIISGLRVAIVKSDDKGNIRAGNLVTRVLDHWKPDYILLVGIGGAVSNVGVLCGKKPKQNRNDLHLGDVVISRHIEYYEYENIENNRTYRRIFVLEPPTGNLRQIAQGIINSNGGWKEWIKAERPEGEPEERPNAYEGIILSGDKVVNDPNFVRKVVCSSFKRERRIAFETEAAGFARAIYDALNSEKPSFLVIRGISDFVDVKGDENTREKWKEYAAQAAAAFAYELVRRIGEGELRRRRENIKPYLEEAKRLFERKNPIDGKALKDYYVEPRVVITPSDTWDKSPDQLAPSKFEEWDFESFLDSDEYYTIIGAPFGVGKTSYVKYLAYKLSGNFEKYNYVPLFVRLREWNKEDFKHNSIQTSEGRLLKDAISEITGANGKVLLILDGLDEFQGEPSDIYRWLISELPRKKNESHHNNPSKSGYSPVASY